MSLNNSAANRVDMPGRLNLQPNPGNMMRPPLSSPLSMPIDMTAHSARSGPYMSMNDHCLINSARNGLPLSLPFDISPHNSSSNMLNMAGFERLHEQTNSAGIVQHPLPLPLRLTSSGLDMINNGLVNAGTRTFTGDGNSGGMIQHAPPSYVPPQMPPQLGQPSMPPVQYDASASNISGADYSSSTIGFQPPASLDLDVSDYGF